MTTEREGHLHCAEEECQYPGRIPSGCDQLGGGLGTRDAWQLLVSRKRRIAPEVFVQHSPNWETNKAGCVWAVPETRASKT